MKKVLIIANLYHAYRRIPGISFYLSQFGWKATIITPPISQEEQTRLGFPVNFKETVKIVEAPYSGDIWQFWRKLFGLLGFKKGTSLSEQIKQTVGSKSKKSFVNNLIHIYEAIFGYPDTEKTWIKPALEVAEREISKEKFSTILSCSPYPSTHLVAKKIKEKYHIPWVADFRDPWSENHNYSYGKIRRALDRRLEKKTIKIADIITTAAPTYSEKQRRIHGNTIVTITNGFDPLFGANIKAEPLKQFTISYTGNVYADGQDVGKLFPALSKFIKENDVREEEFIVRFYGPKYSWIDEEIHKLDVENFVKQYGPVSRLESIKAQKESHVLLIFGWKNLDELGGIPSKVFEYMASGRPTLGIGGSKNEDFVKIMEETRSGKSGSTVDEIKDILDTYWAEFRQTGKILYEGIPELIDQYSLKELAKKFAEVLNELNP